MIKTKIFFSLIFFIFIFNSVVLADVPIVPVMDIMGFSFLYVVTTSGLGLLAVILIETLVLHKKEKINLIYALKISALANIFSTLIGLGIVITYAAPSFSLIFIIIGANIFSKILISFINNTESFPKLKNFSIIFFIIFICGGILAFFLAFLTTPKYDYKTNEYYFTFKVLIVNITAASCLFLMGFILSLISEGFIISRYLKGKKSIVSTVFFMNLFSYIALIIVLLPFIWATIVEKNWFYPMEKRRYEHRREFHKEKQNSSHKKNKDKKLMPEIKKQR